VALVLKPYLCAEIMEYGKKDIRTLTTEELSAFFDTHNEKRFRSKQVMEWLWKKAAGSFDEMSNLSKHTRDLLSEYFVLNKIKLSDEQVSSDRTIKCAFEVETGKVVEGVLIPTHSRLAAVWRVNFVPQEG
jgi:23S rRNA (adenine2503-C2)-methyltransferase